MVSSTLSHIVEEADLRNTICRRFRRWFCIALAAENRPVVHWCTSNYSNINKKHLPIVQTNVHFLSLALEAEKSSFHGISTDTPTFWDEHRGRMGLLHFVHATLSWQGGSGPLAVYCWFVGHVHEFQVHVIHGSLKKSNKKNSTLETDAVRYNLTYVHYLQSGQEVALHGL